MSFLSVFVFYFFPHKISGDEISWAAGIQELMEATRKEGYKEAFSLALTEKALLAA